MIADSLSQGDNAQPMGPILRLLALGMRDLDYDRLLDTAGFLDAYRRSIKAIARYEEEHGRSSYSMTLAGFANATHAAYYLHQSRYFAAIGTGLDALRMLNEAQAADSSNHDVDFFLGLYDYGKAELRKRLWMVLFWYGGDKQQGIARLKRCIDQGQIAVPAAKMSLADIYVREGQFDEARKTLDELLASFPHSRFILWTEVKYFLAREQLAQAARVYGMLADSYALSPMGTINSLITRRKQIESLCKAGKHAEVKRVVHAMRGAECGNDQWRTSEPCRNLDRFLEKGKCHAND